MKFETIWKVKQLKLEVFHFPYCSKNYKFNCFISYRVSKKSKMFHFPFCSFLIFLKTLQKMKKIKFLKFTSQPARPLLTKFLKSLILASYFILLYIPYIANPNNSHRNGNKLYRRTIVKKSFLLPLNIDKKRLFIVTISNYDCKLLQSMMKFCSPEAENKSFIEFSCCL